jgi:hypothetical protein
MHCDGIQTISFKELKYEDKDNNQFTFCGGKQWMGL